MDACVPVVKATPNDLPLICQAMLHCYIQNSIRDDRPAEFCALLLCHGSS